MRACGRRPLAGAQAAPPARHAIAARIRCAAFRAGLALILPVAVAAPAAPYVPADDGEVLERLPTGDSALASEVRLLRAALDADRRNVTTAARLARRYIEIGRARSDPRYFGYAEGVLAPWWRDADAPAPVAVLRATLRQGRHDFDGALADLDRVIAVDARNPQAWVTRAVILQVQGRYGESLESCGRLAQLGAGLAAVICASGAESLNGQAARGYERLRKALEASPRAAPDLLAWGWTLLGEIAERRAEYAAAERHYRQALGVDSRDGYLLGAYSDFLLDLGRAAEVRSLLANETRNNALLLRYVLAGRQLGSPALAGDLEALRARFAEERRRASTVHRREEARFLLEVLERPAEALDVATANWRVQREPWDTRLVLAAALAAGDAAAAAPVLEWLREARLEHARIERLVRQLAQAGR